MTKPTIPARNGITTPAATAGQTVPTPTPSAPAAIDPPQGWLLHALLGFMAYKEGHAGQLVRLADLVRWLEQTRSLPRVAAGGVLCDALPLDAMNWLFRVQAGDYAQLVPPDFGFGYKTAIQIEAAAINARIEATRNASNRSAASFDGFRNQSMRMEAGKITVKPPTPTEPGLPALLRLTRYACGLKRGRDATGDLLDDVRNGLALLAIPIAKAHALWGYGTVQAAEVAAVGVLDSAQLAQPNDWTAPGAMDRLRAEIKDYDDKNKRGGKADAARRYNVEPQRITELLKVKASKAATPFSGLGSGRKAA